MWEQVVFHEGALWPISEAGCEKNMRYNRQVLSGEMVGDRDKAGIVPVPQPVDEDEALSLLCVSYRKGESVQRRVQG